jgi:putative membrane protein
MQRTTKNIIRIGLTLSVIVAAVWLAFGWGWRGNNAWNMGNYGYGHGGWMPYGMMAGGGMGLVMILFWVIVVVALVSLISGIWNNQGPQRRVDDATCAPATGEPDALEILKRRYARGDIDQNEYERMKRELA